MANLLPVFNDQLFQLVDDIHDVFPENADILTAKNLFMTMKKINPKLLVKIWAKYIAGPYRDQIEAGDITFFLEKDYSNDLVKADNAEKIMEAIDRLRGPVKQMSADNQAKTLKYIQNLTKLSTILMQ